MGAELVHSSHIINVMKCTSNSISTISTITTISINNRVVERFEGVSAKLAYLVVRGLFPARRFCSFPWVDGGFHCTLVGIGSTLSVRPLSDSTRGLCNSLG